MNIPQYQTLYKVGASSKVLKWNLSIVSLAGGGYQIRTLYGEQNGKQIEKTSNIDKGKAGRTPLEQATLEANRRYKDKQEKENYTTAINNTGAIQMRPMLAQTFNIEDQKSKMKRSYKMQFPLYVQPKLDGIRCIAHYIPNHGIEMLSRKGTAINNFANIVNKLMELIEQSPFNNKELYIDGELYNHGECSFEAISGVVRAETLTSEHRRIIEKIQYHVYDIYVPDEITMPYCVRYGIIKTIIRRSAPGRAENEHCILVNTNVIESLEEIKPAHQICIENGYEGIMLRDMTSPYEIDKRSKYLQKYKTFLEEEFEIIGYKDEDGMIIFECKTNDPISPREFSVRPRGAFETRRDMYARGGSYIGKHLTVIFQEYTELGTPRFPVGKVIRDYE